MAGGDCTDSESAVMFFTLIVQIRRMLVLFHSFTFFDKNMMQSLLHSEQLLTRVSSKLEPVRVSGRNEDQLSQKSGYEKEKSTQVL